MTDLRDEVVRTKALQDMECNSTVVDVKCDLRFNYKWEGGINYGGLTIGGPQHRSTSSEWVLSKDKAFEVQNLSGKKLTEWTEKEYKERENCSIFVSMKGVSAETYYYPRIYYKIEFFDGEVSWYSRELELDSYTYYDPIINSYKTERDIFTQVTDESVTIKCEEEEIKVEKDTTDRKQSKYEEMIIQYLSDDMPWVNAEFGRVIEQGNTAIFSVNIGDTQFPLSFERPQDTSNNIWNLAEAFDYNDPWNLQREEMQLSLNNVTSKYPFSQDYVHIRPPKRNRNHESILTRIKNKIFSYF